MKFLLKINIIIDVTGIANIIPTIPKRPPKTNIENNTAKGCSPNFFPTNFGVKKFDSNKWPTENTITK